MVLLEFWKNLRNSAARSKKYQNVVARALAPKQKSLKVCSPLIVGKTQSQRL